MATDIRLYSFQDIPYYRDYVVKAKKSQEGKNIYFIEPKSNWEKIEETFSYRVHSFLKAHSSLPSKEKYSTHFTYALACIAQKIYQLFCQLVGWILPPCYSKTKVANLIPLHFLGLFGKVKELETQEKIEQAISLLIEYWEGLIALEKAGFSPIKRWGDWMDSEDTTTPSNEEPNNSMILVQKMKIIEFLKNYIGLPKEITFSHSILRGPALSLDIKEDFLHQVWNHPSFFHTLGYEIENLDPIFSFLPFYSLLMHQKIESLLEERKTDPLLSFLEEVLKKLSQLEKYSSFSFPDLSDAKSYWKQEIVRALQQCARLPSDFTFLDLKKIELPENLQENFWDQLLCYPSLFHFLSKEMWKQNYQYLKDYKKIASTHGFLTQAGFPNKALNLRKIEEAEARFQQLLKNWLTFYIKQEALAFILSPSELKHHFLCFYPPAQSWEESLLKPELFYQEGRSKYLSSLQEEFQKKVDSRPKHFIQKDFSEFVLQLSPHPFTPSNDPTSFYLASFYYAHLITTYLKLSQEDGFFPLSHLKALLEKFITSTSLWIEDINNLSLEEPLAPFQAEIQQWQVDLTKHHTLTFPKNKELYEDLQTFLWQICSYYKTDLITLKCEMDTEKDKNIAQEYQRQEEEQASLQYIQNHLGFF